MAVVFISDIHVLNREDPAYRSLLRLFETGLQPGDTLVLGGDIFDLWVGKHAFFRRDFPEFVPALRRVSDRGCALHWIEGNHDFHLGGAFADVPGLKVHPDELEE
jgi:UDP-2,3-diacylglucosamine hydrolase